MSNTRYSQPQSTQRYTFTHNVFRGVDFVNCPINCDPSRSPWAVNIMPDAAGYPRKRYGWARLHIPSAEQDKKINGMFFYAPANDPDGKRYVVVHAGTKLFIYEYGNGSLTNSTRYDAYTYENNYSAGFQHKDRLYILDGKHYTAMYYDDGAGGYIVKNVSEIATAPITQDGGYYEAIPLGTDPETYEYKWHFGELTKPNLLTARRVNTFAGDGQNKVFWMDSANVKVTKVELYTSATGASTSGKYVKITAAGSTNIRDNHSQTNSHVIGTAQQNATFPYIGTYNSSWYTISYNGRTAYVHTSRSAVVDGSGSSTSEVIDAEWQEITSGFTVAEDNTKRRTKITFTGDAPAAHPDGAGIPSIRVTGVVTETVKHEQTGYDADDAPIILEKVVEIVSVKVNGSAASYTYADGEVTITSTVPANAAVEVEYLRESSTNEGVIEGCRFYGTFGAYNNDVYFVSGNGDHPNRDWASESDDPTCFREDSWTDIGSESNPIMGYMTYQSAQIIVKKSVDDSGALFRRTSQTLSDGTIIFPVKQSFAGGGAVSEHAFAQLRDAPLYLTAQGVYGFISSDLASRYSVQEKSYLINSRLLNEDLSAAVGTAWNNLYLLAFPGSMHCYVADGGQQTAPSNTERSGYEWYYWENIPARCFLVVDNVLFFGTPDGKVCRFCDSLADTNGNDVSAIPAVWATSANQLYSQARTKYIERRGCIFNLTHNAQSFKVAIVTDARKLQADRQTELTPYDDGLDYNIFALTHKSDEEHSDRKGIEAAPYYCINKPIKRFDYVQFVIRNDNAGEDLGVYSIEYQYRYGRYLK